MTPTEFRERGYLDELARRFNQEPAVRALLERAGVPLGSVPPFGHTTPAYYWSEVCRLVGGLIPGGLDALLQAARALPAPQPRREGPRQVPAAAADFVGRQDDLKALLAGFGDGNGSAVAVSGVSGQGGVGKTELALKLAALVGDRYPDGHVFLDLRGFDKERPPLPRRDVMAHVIHSFQPETLLPDGDDRLEGLYHGVLHGRRVLLVLDNAAGPEQLTRLEPPAGCALLVTSRRHFSLRGLKPLDLDALPEADAVTLLRQQAPRLTEAEAAALAAECGRLPLALRVVGSVLAERDDLAPEALLRRLRGEKLTLLGPVTAALRLSERQLPGPLRGTTGWRAWLARRLFRWRGPAAPRRQRGSVGWRPGAGRPELASWRVLAVFAGGFETPWAAAIWGVPDEEAADRLGVLRRASLVEWHSGERSYRLHDLVRDYTRALLPAGQRLEAERRHAELFMELLEEAIVLCYHRHASPEAIRLFDQSWPEIRAAFAWACSRPDDREAQSLCFALPRAAAFLLRRRQHSQEHLEWLRAALAAARRAKDPLREGFALTDLGNAYADLGQPQRAVDCHQQVLASAREAGDRGAEGDALADLARVYADLHQPQSAVECSLRLLAIAQELDSSTGKFQALDNLGCAYTALGQPEQALPCHEQALASARDSSDRWGESQVLCHLGLAHAASNQPQRALQCHQQALAIAREIGDRKSEANVCRHLGDMLVRLDRLGEAVPFLEVRVAFLRRVGHPDAETEAARVEELRRRLAE
jgi:tetratricopeptide (TPR) repeat protein